MGYSNETTHYGIPLPTGSDLTTPMDYNESMTDVDVAVFEAKTDSSSALTKAGQLEVALEETNQNVSAIDGRLTEAEGTIVSQGQAITNLGNKITDLGRDVEDAICSVVEETATAEYNHEVGDYFWYNNTLYITTVDITAGDTIVPNTNCNTVTIATELQKESYKGDVEEITNGATTTATLALDDKYHTLLMIGGNFSSNTIWGNDFIPVALLKTMGTYISHNPYSQESTVDFTITYNSANNTVTITGTTVYQIRLFGIL